MRKSLFSLASAAALLVALTLGFSALASAAGELDAIKAAGKIRIAVFSDKPPFGFVNEDGANEGYDVYLARQLAQDLLGSPDKVEFVLVEAASRMEVLQADKADVVLANFTVTAERAKEVDFAHPYMKVALGVSSPESAPITSVAQLAGKTLIVNKGTTADSYFTENHPEVTLLKFDQNTEGFNALRDGRGVGLAHDNTLLFAWVRENPGFVTGIDFLGSLDTIAPAVKKGNGDLLAWLNEEILRLTGEGFFEKDYQETLAPSYGDSVDPKTVLLTVAELKALAAGEPLPAN
ncbi:MAG: cysteine ABC transporter substrate-binding protein [Deltaproteobacteria bacterium]|jgi:polar amino acid transport system substrate-binding protein|nr:cysteine ABC transporter substrate-binding protein [Deltaproteobacteria bacterium]